jgi:hypothetical protein
MSYVRFGEEGSDVYIYMSVGGWIECCACPLQQESFKAYNTQEMIYHVSQHREAGHFIPYYVEEELREDDKENMKYIEECGNADL